MIFWSIQQTRQSSMDCGNVSIHATPLIEGIRSIDRRDRHVPVRSLQDLLLGSAGNRNPTRLDWFGLGIPF